MYYTDRIEAGHQLATNLQGLGKQNLAIIALSRGAVIVASEIAKKLHSAVYIFAVEDINNTENNPETALSSGGSFSYNTGFSLGDLEEDKEAIRFLSDQRHINEFLELNHIAGKDGTIPKQLLKRHTVILVSDGLNNALSLKVAVEFLRPINTKKLILATPIASAEAIDKMHVLVDQIFCLGSVENFMGSDHYYQNNAIPDDLTVVDIMQKTLLNWQ